MNLDYTSSLSSQAVEALEEAARGIGLPLRKLELLGQDVETAEAFVEHVRAGEHERFLDEVDWEALDERREAGTPTSSGGLEPTAA